MKKSLFLVAIMSCTFICGCQNSPEKHHALKMDEPVTVSIIGGASFPEFLVGKWKSSNTRTKWEFVFEKDGTISEAKIGLGVTIVPGKRTTLDYKEGGQGEYIPGQWFVSYDYNTRELTVDVVIEYFRAQMGQVAFVEGSTKDNLVGIVSADGKKWKTEKLSVPQYKLFMDKEEHDLSADPELIDVEKYLFEKTIWINLL